MSSEENLGCIRLTETANSTALCSFCACNLRLLEFLLDASLGVFLSAITLTLNTTQHNTTSVCTADPPYRRLFTKFAVMHYVCFMVSHEGGSVIASAGISRASCRNQGHNKRDTL